MADIDLSPEAKNALRDKLTDYCEQHFELELEQFDAEFFADFIVKELGPIFFNAGVDTAVRTHMQYCDRIQEEMDAKKIF
jgi:Uncharacterized conserved protein